MNEHTRLMIIVLAFSCNTTTKQSADQKDVSMHIQQPIYSDTNAVHGNAVTVGAIYKHYSGKLYKVIGIAHDSEDPSILRVIYQGLYNCPIYGAHPIWSRKYEVFIEHVVVNGIRQPRFTIVE
jgi:hypothetical protein